MVVGACVCVCVCERERERERERGREEKRERGVWSGGTRLEDQRPSARAQSSRLMSPAGFIDPGRCVAPCSERRQARAGGGAGRVRVLP